MDGRPTSAALPAAGPDLAERVAQTVNAQGYAVVSGVLDREACDALVVEVDRVESQHGIEFGKNDFEGFRTRRIFNLIQHSPRFREQVTEETALGILEAILGVDFLLSGTPSMHISPGETAQLLHADDGMITLPRPHIATRVTTPLGADGFQSRQRSDPARAALAPSPRHAAARRGARGGQRRDAGRERTRPPRLDQARRRGQLDARPRALRALDPVRGRMVSAAAEPDARD